FKTEDFKETEWMQRSEIVANGKEAGKVEVSYLEKRPEEDEGPFLKEEVNLINSIASRIGSYIEGERAQKELDKERRLLRQAEEISDIGGWEYDVKNDEIYWTENLFKLHGFTKGEKKGHVKKSLELYPKKYRKRVEYAFQKAVEEGIPYDLEARFTNADGREMWVETVGEPIIEDGEVIKVVGTMVDITDIKKTEQELKKSQSRLLRSQKLAKVGSWEIDLETNELTWSDETYRIYGVPKDEQMTYEKLLGYIHPEDKGFLDSKWNEALQTGEYDIEHRIVVNGKTKWLKEKADIKFGKEKNPKKVVGSTQDITERKEKEEHIRKNKEKLEKLHEISAELESCTSSQEVYSKAVEAAEKILEFDICSFDEVEDDEFKVKEVSTETPVKGSTGRKLEEGGLGTKTYVNQESFLVDDLLEDEDAKPVKSDYRSAISIPVGEYGVFQAVSIEVGHFDEEDLRMGELLVDHVKESLKRLEMSEREEFLHSLLRHDLKNKTQIVDGYLELMKDYNLPEEVEDYIDKAMKATREGNELIEKVRKLRKIEVQEEIGDINIDTIMDQIFSEHRDQLEEKNIELDIEKSGCIVEGGPLLKELFSNLIENSIKHSGCDFIRIRAESKDDESIVVVEDNGKGISDETKEKILEKGFRKGENAGSGLGLYIVKEIANKSGGKIEVKDSEFGGVRIDVTLILKD
ncbi:MAG: PAS domain-containing protein, partial [Thermoplasmatota archaeon]